MPNAFLSLRRNPNSPEGRIDAKSFTPGPELTGAVSPVAISMRSRVVSPSSGAVRNVQVSSADMQYATTLLLSLDHLGEPQKSPCFERRFNPLPSGRTR